MIERTGQRQAEAHTTTRAMLRVIQAITAKSVEYVLELLEEHKCLLFQEFVDNYGFVVRWPRLIIGAAPRSLPKKPRLTEFVGIAMSQ